MELAWVDTVLGGSGILLEMAAAFPAVASAAARHLEGHDCPSSCYRCLRTYRNQRVHRLLNWRLVLPYLRAAAGEAIRTEGRLGAAAHVVDGPEWEEARREGCESPQELRLLRAIRAAGLPEPEKQYEVREGGILLTEADFAYPAQRVLIYVDGLAFHSSIRQRVHDNRQTNELQNLGYRVLRFLGREIPGAPAIIAAGLQGGG
jgi:very-short-patch-repair endonuclease